MASESRNRLLEKVRNPGGLSQDKVDKAQAILDAAMGVDQDEPAGELIETPLLVEIEQPNASTGEFRHGLIVPGYVTGMRERNPTVMNVRSQSTTIPQTDVYLLGGAALTVAMTLDQLFDLLWPPIEYEDEPPPAPPPPPAIKKGG